MKRNLILLTLTIAALTPLVAAAKPAGPPKPHIVVPRDRAPRPHGQPAGGHHR